MQNVPLPLHAIRTGSDVADLLLGWYADFGRSFPWRLPRQSPAFSDGRPLHDPWMILVGEVMLQQTGTARVVEKLPLFLQRFPSVAALAAAPAADVIQAWKGMGYNRRVLNLQKAAQAIEVRFDGVVPSSAALLESLPGIGRYTASAIACFAYGAQVPVVDVNVVRVLGRIFQRCHSDSARASASLVWRIDEAILPAGDAYRWHQGVMDLGATICLPVRPRCSRCPAVAHCLSAYPLSVPLFDSSRGATPEPSILGLPRRIWRGRTIEILRGEQEGIRLGDLLDRLLPPGAVLDDRRLFFPVIEGLRADGLLESHGVVREGDLGEGDLVGLPR